MTTKREDGSKVAARRSRERASWSVIVSGVYGLDRCRRETDRVKDALREIRLTAESESEMILGELGRLSLLVTDARPPLRNGQLRSSLRACVLERDGHRCVECGLEENLCVDHAIPRALGGSDESWNLDTLCATCNDEKGSRLVESALLRVRARTRA